MNEILEALEAWRQWFEHPEEELPADYFSDTAEIAFVSSGFNSSRFICSFDTEKVKFDVAILMTDKEGEENAAALVKLAIISLRSTLDEKVEVKVDDVVADYNGGTIEDYLLLLDKESLNDVAGLRVIYP
ncbi:MAG: hypothetical protein MJ109_05410 [Kiritimatiellae bacterium]|nr:hypothetical protein [Kiritimatiellia bacterium]